MKGGLDCAPPTKAELKEFYVISSDTEAGIELELKKAIFHYRTAQITTMVVVAGRLAVALLGRACLAGCYRERYFLVW